MPRATGIGANPQVVLSVHRYKGAQRVWCSLNERTNRAAQANLTKLETDYKRTALKGAASEVIHLLQHLVTAQQRQVKGNQS